MNEPARPSPAAGRRVTPGVAVALAATAVLLVVGVVALVLGLRGSPAGTGTSGTSGLPPSAAGPAVPGGPAPSDAPTTSDAPRTGVGGRSATTAPGALAASAPTSLEIPSIGVRSRTFVPLTVQRDGTISVPGTAQEIGLYDAGPTPGELGPSVLAAHVDTPAGVPGIFAQLRRVKAGDVVRINRHDGSRLTFTVDRVAAYKKTAFPTDLVYKSDFRRAEIRLVTCGGPTDRRNEYRDNVIVFARLSHIG
ncbi:sortase domain-bontaining protein [Intrasporangium sp. YIM S08009]|uniref:sortase domain-containing protein n=1 Tax=Intrasporangium zincisolvens TaxID=3080018 RepID=UPI002B0566B5|nr:sortase [Intrasporangium sp. YIM S08009]